MDVRLGFIVLEKEVESLKGAIVPGEEDVQFNIWKLVGEFGGKMYKK